METEDKIVRMLIEKKRAFTIRGIAKKIKADYKITHIAAQKLISKGIVNKENIGSSSLCSLNPEYYGKEIYDIEYERAQELLKDKDIGILSSEIMRKTGSSLFVFIIFGSYAKKIQKKNSDIDLMFVCNEKGFERRIEMILGTLPLKIHFFVFNESEFKNMLESKESNVVKEAVQGYIILYGIENYYRLLKC